MKSLSKIKALVDVWEIDNSNNGNCPMCNFNVAYRHSYHCKYRRPGIEIFKALIEVIEVQSEVLEYAKDLMLQEMMSVKPIGKVKQAQAKVDEILEGIEL